jgi:class 3 adenylate cyclase
MLAVDEPLACFLPTGLLGRIHGDRGGRLPAAVELPAAVMFVDVSRYTSLVEQLAQRGRDGLEQIPTLLGRSYARCAEHIYDLGGEVLHFAGDALLAYWPGEEAGLREAAAAAVACAERICGERAGDREAQGEPALHVGVGAGRLWAAALGGRPSWSLVVGGPAMRQAAVAQGGARRWQYVLSPDARQELGELEPSRFRAPTPATGTAPPPGSEWLTGFLPSEMRAVVLGGRRPGTPPSGIAADAAPNGGGGLWTRLEPLAEVRPVTALFARVTGLDVDTPEALGRHQILCETLQEILARRDGPGGQLVFDDKGLVFVAVFGTPGSFHRDDALRAVDAAHAIGPAAAALGLHAAVGVATGDALFRVVGGPRRRQLMVLGAPMNRAARLMTAQETGVLCDAPTERACRTGFLFAGQGALQLEGLGQTAAVFRPVERRQAAQVRAPLLGRRRELELLERAFEEARAGQRRLVVVLGAPGIGKTRLVESFTEGLQGREVAVAVARAERGDRQTSFLPWRRVLAALLAVPAGSDGRGTLAALEARFAGKPAVLARLPLLGGVLDLSIPESEGTRHLEGPNRADATMRFLGELLGALAPRPFVVVLEDSQWLDSASWRLVEWVLSALTSLLVVVCVRAEETPDELKGLRRRADTWRVGGGAGESDDPARFCRILDLEELDAGSIRELVARTLGEGPPDEELVRRVGQLAGGNPFFAEEIVLTWRSEGLIAMRDGCWRPIRSLEEFRHFDGVERVIRERVDRLDAEAQGALKAAAVIGRGFTTQALAGLLEGQLDGAAMSAALDVLETAHLVRRVGGPGGYEFRHDQTRDVVYGSIPTDLRQRLHGALAAWLESASSDRSRTDIATLVQHYHAAGEKERTVKYASLAATHALQLGAFREAEAFVSTCLRHEAPEPWGTGEKLQAVRWRRQLGEAHYGLGDLRAQGLAVRRALTLAGAPAPASSLALLGRLLRGAVRLALGQLSRRRRGASPEAAPWDLELARCLSQAAVVDYFELRMNRAFLHALSAVNHAQRAGLSTELVQAYSQLGCALGISGFHRGAEHFMRRAEAAVEELGDPAAQAQVCNLDALWRIGYAEWPEVDQRLDQGQSLSLAAGDQLTWCNSQAIRFWALYYRGDRSAIEDAADALLARAQNSGNLQQEIWALRCRALCALRAERPREAAQVLRVVTTAMPESADLAERVASQGGLALALTRIGHHSESIEVATEALRLLKRMPRPTVHSTLDGVAGIAEVFLRGREAGLSREYDQWRVWERRALHELARFGRAFPVGAAKHGLWSGVADWLDGRRRRAMATWRQALATARRMSLREDESMIAAEIRRREDS